MSDPLASPTFVHNVPNGSETGTFIALDLGGTNLRVCEVTLQGKGEYSIRQEKFKVSEELKTGDAKALFTYIAQRCAGRKGRVRTLTTWKRRILCQGAP
jgi:hexokinase